MTKSKIFFLIILLLALFLRVFNLDKYPPSLNWDEISIGYNAYSILETGKDEWGRKFPLSFRAYGDYKLPFYIYVDTIFIKIFGLNEYGVRLPSALFGGGIVILIYLILKKITNNETTSLVGMFLASITPWLVILSRIALEANSALFLITLFVYLFILGVESKKIFILAFFSLGLSLFAYNSARVIFLPVIISFLILFWKKIIKKDKILYLSYLTLIIFVIVALPNALLQDSSARFRWTTILDEGAMEEINQQRGRAYFSPAIEKVLFNKLTYFLPRAFNNYFNHFHTDFLFFKGGSHYQYSVPGNGLFLISILPLSLFGIYYLIKKKTIIKLFILTLLFISPIPAAITRDAPHPLRSLFMITPLLIISAFGFGCLLEKKIFSKLKICILILFILVSLIQFAFFWKNYTVDYPKNYSWAWQWGYKEAIDFINKHGKEYDKIVITKRYGEPHEFLLFYSKYEPQKYLDNPSLVRYKRSDWYWVDKFDKFEFINDWEVIEKVKGKRARRKDLLVTSPENYPSNAKLIKTIYFLNNSPAFDILEI